MNNLKSSIELDPKIDVINRLSCIEVSEEQNLLYTAGGIFSTNFSEKCPVVVIDYKKNEVKGKDGKK